MREEGGDPGYGKVVRAAAAENAAGRSIGSSYTLRHGKPHDGVDWRHESSIRHRDPNRLGARQRQYDRVGHLGRNRTGLSFLLG